MQVSGSVGIAKLSILLAFLIYVQGTDFPKPSNVDYFSNGQDWVAEALKRKWISKTAKNVIVFIGDGMGLPTITASRIYAGQKMGSSGEENQFSFEKFANAALSKTYNADRQGSDSASTATAILTGEKVNQGTLGVNKNVQLGDCSAIQGNELDSLIYHSYKAGKRTGLVSTARVTHATPAASYAHSADREHEHEIVRVKVDLVEPDKCTDHAKQLVRDNEFINVILGGGRRAFYNETVPDEIDPTKFGRRKDGLDLVQEWKDNKAAKSATHQYVRTKQELNGIDTGNTEFLLGLFANSHIPYQLDTDENNDDSVPTVAELTEKAIQVLTNDDEGYFLLVEGARIDHAHHDSKAKKALEETVQLDLAVAKAVELTKDKGETLIVVTADHSHVFTIGGYSDRGTDVLGFVKKNVNYDEPFDYTPYLVLTYGNGPGHQSPRINFTEEQVRGNDFQQESMVGTEYETHGSEDVAIYAEGPMGHLFHGTMEENFIAHVVMQASCIGPYTDNCNEKNEESTCNSAAGIQQNLFSLLLFVALFKMLL